MLTAPGCPKPLGAHDIAAYTLGGLEALVWPEPFCAEAVGPFAISDDKLAA